MESNCIINMQECTLKIAYYDEKRAKMYKSVHFKTGSLLGGCTGREAAERGAERADAGG